MDQQVLHDIVEKAARAPSIHNTQPWRFVAHDDLIELWTDPNRGLAVLDPTGRARHLSCGAALLHARIAAEAAGYPADVVLAPDGTQPEHLADLRLASASSTGPHDLADAISNRRTEREAFTPEPLNQDVVEALRRAAEAEGCWLRVVDSSDDETAVAVLLARADALESEDPSYREELRRWTGRGTDARDGVPPSAVPGTDPSRRGTNFRLRDFVADRDETGSDDGTDGADSSEDPPAVERPLVALLGTRDDDVAAWLAAGQGLARLLLTATSLGVAASPMTQPLEIPETRSRLATELGVLGHPQMLLRLGHANDDGLSPAPARTPRRTVQDMLEVHDEDPLTGPGPPRR